MEDPEALQGGDPDPLLTSLPYYCPCSTDKKVEVQRGVTLEHRKTQSPRGLAGAPFSPHGPATRHLVGTRLAVPKTKIPSVVAVAEPNYSRSPGDRGCQDGPGGDTGARVRPRSLDTTPALWEGLIIASCAQGETEEQKDSVLPLKSQTGNRRLKLNTSVQTALPIAWL